MIAENWGKREKTSLAQTGGGENAIIGGASSCYLLTRARTDPPLQTPGCDPELRRKKTNDEKGKRAPDLRVVTP